MKFLLWVSSTELLTELQWVRVPKKRTYGPDMNSSRDVHADTFSELVMEPIFCSKNLVNEHPLQYQWHG